MLPHKRIIEEGSFYMTILFAWVPEQIILIIPTKNATWHDKRINSI